MPAPAGAKAAALSNDRARVLARLHECRTDGATCSELMRHLGWPRMRVGAALAALTALGHAFGRDHVNGDNTVVVVWMKS